MWRSTEWDWKAWRKPNIKSTIQSEIVLILSVMELTIYSSWYGVELWIQDKNNVDNTSML